MSTLLAWRGRLSREECLTRARAHIEADLLAHGATGDVLAGQRGCSVACTVGTYDHSLYPEELGLPEWLGRLQDTIYECLPQDERRLDVCWTEDLLGAIADGVEVDLALRPILARILEEVALPAVTDDQWGVRDAVRGVVAALRREGDLAAAADAADDAADAARAAWAAARAAWAAARAARGAAWAADAADAAWERIRAIVLEELGRLEAA